MVKARQAHPELARELIHSERLGKVFAQPPPRLRYAAGMPSRSYQMAEPRTLPSFQKPVNNLSNDERRQKLALLGRFEKPDQSDDRVEHVGVDRADVRLV